MDFDKTQDELAYWLALHRTPQVGAVTFLKLLEHYQEVAAIFSASHSELSGEAKLRKQSIEQIKQPDWAAVEQDLRWLESENNHLITFHDQRYPALLKELSDPPPLLFACGKPQLLQGSQLAIVGSRNPSATGKENAQQFASYLSQGGVTITSGLAMGVDAAAHQGALNASGQTIAVLGTGIDRIYPSSHHEMAHAISEKGLLLSELPLGSKPLAANFPRRNRIISGLSLGTLVIEAALKSGSLITARLAAEQGREVFAIPGSIHNPLAKGCHFLIKQGAKLVETAQDIIEELGAIAQLTEAHDSRLPTQTDEAEIDSNHLQVLNAIGFDPTSIDQIIERCGLTADAVSSILLMLELKSRVSSSGGHYSRTSHKGKT